MYNFAFSGKPESLFKYILLAIVLTDSEERADNSSYCPAQDINLMRTNPNQKLSFYMDSPDTSEACVL